MCPAIVFVVLSLVVLGLVSCDFLEPFWLSNNLGDSNIVGDDSKCETDDSKCGEEPRKVQVD